MSSTSSKTAWKHRRYRMRAPTAQVNDDLFGGAAMIGTAPETILLLNRDHIRTIRVPRKDPPVHSTVLPSDVFKEKMLRCTDPPKDQQARRINEEKLEAANLMKQKMHEADVTREKTKAPTQEELEDRERDQRLLKRAKSLLLEEEDEIKALNRMILRAHCNDERDAQVQERKQIQLEQLEEKKRLDNMVETERVRLSEKMEQVEELRKKQRFNEMQLILDQIKEHEQEKQVQRDLIEKEKREFLETQERMRREDLRELEKKREEQQRLQEEVMRINSESIRAKQKRREEERLANLKDLEYMKMKAKREEEREEEQKRIMKERELELARLRAEQKKALDQKAEQDVQYARRAQALKDREWRAKQKELAVKKVQEDEKLRVARLEQVRCTERHLAEQASLQKAEFERVLKVQQDALNKFKQDEANRRQKALMYAEKIRQQIKEHQRSMLAERKKHIMEINKLREDEQQRSTRLDECKQQKLHELRAAGISDKYCCEVERKCASNALAARPGPPTLRDNSQMLSQYNFPTYEDRHSKVAFHTAQSL